MHATLLLLSLLAQAAPVNARVFKDYTAAQSDPNAAVFTPSGDDSSLTKYLLQIYVVGQTTPKVTIDLGKPSIDGGQIVVNFAALAAPFAVPGEAYEAKVVAVSPGGSSASPPSNQFRYSRCAPTLNPSTLSITAAGQSVPVKIVVPADCAWNIEQGAYWLSASARSGTGPATVTVTAPQTDSSKERTGAMFVNGWRLQATQPGVPCTINVPQGSLSFKSYGGTQNLNVSAPQYCPWTATSAASWLAPGNGGSGDGFFMVTVQPNPSATARSTTLQVGSVSVPVWQEAVACTQTVDANLPNPHATVVGASQWTWSTTYPPALERAGNTNKVAAAWFANDFTVDITIPAGRTQQVSLYMVDYDGPGRSQKVDILDGATLLDSRQVDNFVSGRYLTWALSGHVTIHLSRVSTVNSVLSGIFFGQTGTGTGNTAAFVGADDTTQGAWKTKYGTSGYMIVSDETKIPVMAKGGTATFTVTSPGGCPWTSSSAVAWMTATSTGNGNGTASVTIQPNTGPSRTGTVTIGAVVYTVFQEGS